MADFRQENHNGRVSTTTGAVYNRSHNDREFDVSRAENINPDMMRQNIIIHYDAHNNPTIIDSTDPNRVSIDAHEHAIYEELFQESLANQHARNNAARHPERNKTVDDLLNHKNYCPEETIFQIGSLRDGYPDPSILMDIFDDFQRELIGRYGDNLHFLDAVLHMDEAVPHIHIRKVWTYHGKDGLDISQNKALEEMGFERPNPEKSINKWNNAKITFSEMERNLKLRICEDHGLSVEHTPLHPGKATMEKEEAIALKLQEENQEYREETDRLIDERKDKISSLDATIEKKESKLEKVSADLVTEEMKNKAIADTNIFGKPKMITVTPQEYRSWQKSAETKKSNEAARSELRQEQNRLYEYKRQLEVLSVLDQQMIDRSTAQKLHKIGYPNMEGRPFEDVLDIAEERDIFDLLKQHAPSLDAKNVTTNDYNTVIEAVREGTTLEAAAKAMAEKLVEKFPPTRYRGHGR